MPSLLDSTELRTTTIRRGSQNMAILINGQSIHDQLFELSGSFLYQALQLGISGSSIFRHLLNRTHSCNKHFQVEDIIQSYHTNSHPYSYVRFSIRVLIMIYHPILILKSHSALGCIVNVSSPKISIIQPPDSKRSREQIRKLEIPDIVNFLSSPQSAQKNNSYSEIVLERYPKKIIVFYILLRRLKEEQIRSIVRCLRSAAHQFSSYRGAAESGIITNPRPHILSYK